MRTISDYITFGVALLLLFILGAWMGWVMTV